MTDTITITAGRLLCHHVRDLLKLAKFRGYQIEWIESSGWIEREFTIRGDEQSLKIVGIAFQKWAKELESVK